MLAILVIGTDLFQQNSICWAETNNSEGKILYIISKYIERENTLPKTNMDIQNESK